MLTAALRYPLHELRRSIWGTPSPRSYLAPPGCFEVIGVASARRPCGTTVTAFGK